MRCRSFWMTLVITVVAFDVRASQEEGGIHWPSFRGPQARGVADGYATPAVWDVEGSKNIRWRISIPGLAHSSPIIWGDRLFLTTAISGDEGPPLRVGLYGDIDSVDEKAIHRWRVYCIDKATGKLLWSRTAHEGVPKIKRHPKSTHANPTPATDGSRVVAFFGSEGLYCYDMEGDLLWKRDLGVLDAAYFEAPEAQWGFASSPIIHGDMVIVQCDVLGDSFLAAFDVGTGRELWRTQRDDVPTWSTPTVHRHGDRDLLIVNGWKHVGGYDAATGKELWRLTGGGDIPVPTPVVAHGLVFITHAHGPGSPLYAIRLDARGDITLSGRALSNEHVAWSLRSGGSYMQTPLVYGDYLYNCRINGVLSCYRAATGERLYQERLGGGGFSASPVAGGGKLYIASEDGDVYVVQAGPEFKLLAVNSLDEIAMATPAISEGSLYFRTQGHLLAVGGSQ